MTHLFQHEITEQDYEIIRSNLQAYHDHLMEQRMRNVVEIYRFFKIHNRTPSCISNDSNERNMAFLYKKLKNPDNKHTLKKELDTIMKHDFQFYVQHFANE